MKKVRKSCFWALLLTYKSTLYLFRKARYEHLKFFTNKNASNFETMGLRVKLNGNYLIGNFWALLLTYKSTLYLFRKARYEHLKFFTNKNASNFETMGLRVKLNGNYLIGNFWALLLTYKSTLYLFRKARYEWLKVDSSDKSN